MGEELQIKPNGSRDENGGRSPPSPVPFDSPHFLLSFGVWRFREQRHSRTRKKKKMPAGIAGYLNLLLFLLYF